MSSDEVGFGNGAPVPTDPPLRYSEVDDLFRQPAARVAGTHPGRDAFVPGAFLFTDGPAHQERRRLLMTLLAEPELRRLEAEVLVPSLTDSMRRLAQSAPPGSEVSTDLMLLMENIFWSLAAQFVGIDGVGSEDAAQFIQEVLTRLRAGMTVDVYEKERERRVADGRRARDEFFSTYFLPSANRRRALIEQAEAGTLDEAELPRDALTLLLRAGYPDETILSDAIVLLNATAENNSNVVADCLINLKRWSDSQPSPQSAARMLSNDFLWGVVEESVRLRGSTRLRVRHLVDDVTAGSTGRRFARGQTVVVDLGASNRDEAAFGANAAQFDPFRTSDVRGVQPHGVAFGVGRHLCMGKMLALGDRRTRRAGILVPMVRTFLEAGVSFDPDRDPVAATEENRYISFPVTFSSIHETLRGG